MSSSALSDEQIYSALEAVVDYFCSNIPVERAKSFHPGWLGKELVEKLQQEYNPRMAHAFLRAVYWHMTDTKMMEVTPNVSYMSKEKLTEEQKTDLCMRIFSEYEKYLQANYKRSLIEPGFPPKNNSQAPIKNKVFSAGK